MEKTWKLEIKKFETLSLRNEKTEDEALRRRLHNKITKK